MKYVTAMRCGILGLSLMAFSGTAVAQENQHWITTLVNGSGFASSSKIETQVIEECVKTLPKESDLEAVVDAKSVYMKNINGDLKDNRSVRTFNAKVTVPYSVRRKLLLVVTTASIEGSEPKIQEVQGTFDESIEFDSNAENGDQYSGRGLVLDYYFSTRALANDDAVRRAKVWLKKQRAVTCGK